MPQYPADLSVLASNLGRFKFNLVLPRIPTTNNTPQYFFLFLLNGPKVRFQTHFPRCQDLIFHYTTFTRICNPCGYFKLLTESWLPPSLVLWGDRHPIQGPSRIVLGHEHEMFVVMENLYQKIHGLRVLFVSCPRIYPLRGYLTH